MNKIDMEREIKALIRQYSPNGTTFKWGRGVRVFGTCSYKRNRFTGEYYDFKIIISYPLASRNDWETVKRTVIHEIAHSRTAGHGHDAIWRRECIALGGDGKRCYTNTRNGGDVVPVPYKYVGVCPVCGVRFYRNRLTNGIRYGYHCNRNSKIVWTDNLRAA